MASVYFLSLRTRAYIKYNVFIDFVDVQLTSLGWNRALQVSHTCSSRVCPQCLFRILGVLQCNSGQFSKQNDKGTLPEGVSECYSLVVPKTKGPNEPCQARALAKHPLHLGFRLICG